LTVPEDITSLRLRSAIRTLRTVLLFIGDCRMRPCCGPVLAKSAEGPHIGWATRQYQGAFQPLGEDVRAVASRIVQTAIHFASCSIVLTGRRCAMKGQMPARRPALSTGRPLRRRRMASMPNIAPTSAPVGTVRRVHSQSEFGVRLGLSLAAFLQMSQRPAYSRMSRPLARLRRPLLPQIWSRPG
jgi:hypothetical protein